MDDMKMTAKIVTTGFQPNELRPRKMWTVLQNNFVELYNDYCEISNKAIPALNKYWNEIHQKEDENEDSEKNLEVWDLEIRDLKDKIQKMEYGCYMRDHFDRCAFRANERHPDSYLSGFVFMDGDLPVFGARIKQHPEMYMTFVIESK